MVAGTKPSPEKRKTMRGASPRGTGRKCDLLTPARHGDAALAVFEVETSERAALLFVHGEDVDRRNYHTPRLPNKRHKRNHARLAGNRHRVRRLGGSEPTYSDTKTGVGG